MDIVNWTIIFVIIFTFVKVSFEIKSESNSYFYPCFNFLTVSYFLLVCITSIFVTILSLQFLNNVLTNGLQNPFIYAILGVFGFEVIIRKTNISMHDIGILTIQNWLSKAKEKAIAETVLKNAYHSRSLEYENLNQILKRLNDSDLDFQINLLCPQNRLKEIKDLADKSGNSHSYKAWVLVKEYPLETYALIKNNKPKNQDLAA